MIKEFMEHLHLKLVLLKEEATSMMGRRIIITLVIHILYREQKTKMEIKNVQNFIIMEKG